MNGLEAQSLGTSGKVGSSGKVVGVLRSGRLLLEFSTQVGRVAHALQYVGEQETVTLLESVEGTDEDWPPSPPYQQLSVEPTAEGGEIAFLVGMAGRSHWSASIQPLEQGFLFEVACRAREQPEQLGSIYRLGETCQAIQSNSEPQRINRLTLPQGVLIIQCLDQQPPATIAWEQRACRVMLPSPSTSLPSTFQWSYRIEFETSPS